MSPDASVAPAALAASGAALLPYTAAVGGVVLWTLPPKARRMD